MHFPSHTLFINDVKIIELGKTAFYNDIYVIKYPNC